MGSTRSGLMMAAALVLFAAVPAFAQGHADQKQEGAPADRPSPSKPGPEQAYLAKRAGEYARSVKFLGQPNAVGAPAGTGTAKISVILDGRFIQEENNDTVFGRPVSGMRLWGYNNVTKQYEAVWTYTMSTAITMLTGTSSDGGKTIEFTSTGASGGNNNPLHAVVRQVTDDQFVVTLSTAGPDGKEAAFQETTYTRKK
jgi:hypothetical protein